ncbi:MAG: L,D-transpeptidase family protein [Deferribacteraceae bacterium]|jgi:murein L,D-transpeptidase YafK|nr:L,D-transpeptidase family protein [Deferribacteraceae bacterium]
MFKYVSIFLFLFPVAIFAQERYIGNVMADGSAPHYTLVVEKSPKKLYLLKIDGDNQTLLDNFTVLTGEFDGNKMIEGDKKTPEGIYYITEYMDAPTMRRKFGSYASTYGTGAYPVNYPNPIDRILKKTGYGIWVHGLDPERHKPATEGCVGMQNVDLDQIKPNLSIGMPVVIIDNASFMNKEAYAKQRNAHLDELNKFIEAWSYGSYDIFSSYVHPKYSSYSGKSAKAYLDKKKQLMGLYPDKQISVDNINVYRQNNDTLVYDFDQLYCAPNLVSYGNKRIYLVNDNGTNKVISEEMRSIPVRSKLDPSISAFLSSWKLAWESKDIKGYIDFYSPKFANRAAWQEDKEKIFAAAGKIDVKISDIKWAQKGGNNFTISFTQKYSSDKNSDLGIKTLEVEGCPGAYKIKSERWSRS